MRVNRYVGRQLRQDPQIEVQAIASCFYRMGRVDEKNVGVPKLAIKKTSIECLDRLLMDGNSVLQFAKPRARKRLDAGNSALAISLNRLKRDEGREAGSDFQDVCRLQVSQDAIIGNRVRVGKSRVSPEEPCWILRVAILRGSNSSAYRSSIARKDAKRSGSNTDGDR